MESSFTFWRVRGIAVGAHWSWLLVVALVVWSLAGGVFPAAYPHLGGAVHLLMALVATVVLFGSVLLHELGHALRALAEGTPIRGITLWLFGGVAHLAGAPASAGAEFRVAVCGPLVSLALALAFGLVAWLGRLVGIPDPAQGVLDYLVRINLLVLAFNLVPAFPLDGGRVLRSWLWQRRRDYAAATRSAARAGQVFGLLLVAVGLVDALGRNGDSGSIWLGLLGWFLVRAAGTEALVRSGDGPATPATGAVGETTGAAVETTGVVGEATGAGGTTTGPSAGATPDGEPGAGGVAVAERDAGQGEDPAPARRSPLVWVVVGLAMAVAVASLYRPPYIVISPGSAIDVGGDIRIDGQPMDELNGRYLLTTVHVARPTALTLLWSKLQDHHEVLSLSSYLPPGVSSGRYSAMQRDVFVESRRLAAAAAARAVGLEVTIRGSGVQVVGLLDGSPAADRLAEGDVIVSVDGRPVQVGPELGEAIRARPAGSLLRLVVERGGARQDVELESRELPGLSGGPGIGVAITTRDLAVDLPFDIRFESRDIGGPSAGLAYALAIADVLDPGDFARGRAVAATGTIDVEGDVGAVGGVEQKSVAVASQRADLFLVPADETTLTRGSGLRVEGVRTLEEALARLGTA